MAKIFCTLFLLLASALMQGQEVDFDDVFVGTNPICLLEALYRHHLGHRVLIVEKDDRCGGAWKSIDACGIKNVDLGCHHIGEDDAVEDFIKRYLGCHTVDLENPLKDQGVISKGNRDASGFYFASGCVELVEAILRLIEKTDIVLLLNHKVESIYIDKDLVRIKVGEDYYKAAKVVTTAYSSLFIENCPATFKQNSNVTKFFHLYLLIEDPGVFTFTYMNSLGSGTARLMNLTPFVGLHGTGFQMVVIQTHGEDKLSQSQDFLQKMKSKNLVSSAARIVKEDRFLYQQTHFSLNALHAAMPASIPLIESLETSSFLNMSKYIAKWKEVMQPLHSL